MLTSNIAEIIKVIKGKIESNSLSSCSSETIKNISLLLWGYLQLVKSDFKTPDDTHEPNDSYHEQLKNILDKLTEAQTKNLKKIKDDLFQQTTQELNKVTMRIASTTKYQNKEFTQCVSNLSQSIKTLEDALKKKLYEVDGFQEIMFVFFQCSSELNSNIVKLQEFQLEKDLIEYLNALHQSLSFYLRKIVFWRDMEHINLQCKSYVTSSAFIDLFY